MGAEVSQSDLSELKFLYEGHEEFSTIPSYAVIPAMVCLLVDLPSTVYSVPYTQKHTIYTTHTSHSKNVQGIMDDYNNCEPVNRFSEFVSVQNSALNGVMANGVPGVKEFSLANVSE